MCHAITPSGFDLQITLSISVYLISLNSTHNTLVKLLFTDSVKMTLAGDGLLIWVNLPVNFCAIHEKSRVLFHHFRAALSLLEREIPSSPSFIQNDIKIHPLPFLFEARCMLKNVQEQLLLCVHNISPKS